jgi:hypothetical protein
MASLSGFAAFLHKTWRVRQRLRGIPGLLLHWSVLSNSGMSLKELSVK